MCPSRSCCREPFDGRLDGAGKFSTGGRLRSQVRLAEAREQTAVLFYQLSIQGAFRNVSDALVAYRKTREFRTPQELFFRSAEDAARLSHMRCNGGVTGYLEVLTDETNAFSTELGVVQARLNELLAVVQLYQSLAGSSAAIARGIGCLSLGSKYISPVATFRSGRGAADPRGCSHRAGRAHRLFPVPPRRCRRIRLQ
jgi:hypothetical protein